ncbi:hypothetical protein AXF42_Ash017292 [Apostasia shenzhenica]|uniref:Uncharacterized protein n=1 Tax=Apostasia shenzhenica TaxID=1088818 RepID=A0A2H9ZVN1_9ASPA|nr:hypothetical protein AXF42_Ash017292 [Apostasia shenzhenica]
MTPVHLSYVRLGRRCRRNRVLRQISARICAFRLRFRLLTALGLLRRFLQRLNKSFRRKREPAGPGNSAGDGSQCKLRSYGRSNSFYAEAIAECLEFIRKTSASVGDGSMTPASVTGAGAAGR